MSITNLCNLALSQVPAGTITSIDEASVQARACKLWYPQVVAELLPRSTWRFARKRAALAAIDINSREGEWGYIYAVPSDMAFPIKVMDSGQLGEYQHEFAASAIYAQAPDAVIEYVTTQDMTTAYDGLFKAALIATLASRIVMPITKNTKRQAELINTAEIAVQRAVAFNANLQPASYMNHVPDVLAARHGLLDDGRRYPGPEAVYPDFDPVGTFESELDT